MAGVGVSTSVWCTDGVFSWRDVEARPDRGVQLVPARSTSVRRAAGRRARLCSKRASSRCPGADETVISGGFDFFLFFFFFFSGNKLNVTG